MSPWYLTKGISITYTLYRCGCWRAETTIHPYANYLMEHIFYKLIRITIYFGGVFLFVLLIFPPSFENYWLQLKKKLAVTNTQKIGDRWSLRPFLTLRF